MFRRAVRSDQSATGVWVGRSILSADQIKHDFSLIVELKTEPIPAHLIFSQLIATELVIHPTQPVDFFCFAVNRNLALAFQSRQRVVVGSSPVAFPFLTETVVTVQHRRLK